MTRCILKQGFVGLILGAAVCTSLGIDYRQSWTRFPQAEEPLTDLPAPFAIGVIQNDGQSLLATCALRFVAGTDSIILQGATIDGMFRPAVRYEVATSGKDEWKTIAQSPVGFESESIVIGPDNPRVKLFISLDPFRPTIGIYRYGRLVLESGNSVVFAIENLLPTRASHGEDDDFTDDVVQTDEEKRCLGFREEWILHAAASFQTVTSLGGRIVGEFGVTAESARVTLKGSRTSDGDFWPEVTLQVANQQRVWTAVDRPRHGGVAEVLRVAGGHSENVRILLSNFRPFIGKFKYGKISFSDGSFTVIWLDLLKP